MLFEYSRSRLYFYGKAYGLFQKSVLKMIIVTDMVIKSLFVWFSRPKLEMKQLQSRYNQEADQGRIKTASLRRAALITVPQPPSIRAMKTTSESFFNGSKNAS